MAAAARSAASRSLRARRRRRPPRRRHARGRSRRHRERRLVRRSRSAPAPPLTTSRPRPPVSTSSPASPKILSLPPEPRSGPRRRSADRLGSVRADDARRDSHQHENEAGCPNGQKGRPHAAVDASAGLTRARPEARCRRAAVLAGSRTGAGPRAPELACRECAGGSYSRSRQSSRRSSQLAAAPSPSELVRVDSWRVESVPKPRVPARAAVDVVRHRPADRRSTASPTSTSRHRARCTSRTRFPRMVSTSSRRSARGSRPTRRRWTCGGDEKTRRGRSASTSSPFPGCTTKSRSPRHRLRATAPPGSSYLGDIGGDRLMADLGQLGNLTNLKHLVYYDGPPVFDDNVCGTSVRPEVGDHERRGGGDRVRLDEVAVRRRHRRRRR